MNWDDLKYVLAVAKFGSLSAAARQLRTTQPTVGRRISALESDLGVKIVRRVSGSLALTKAGLAILQGLERIEAETLAIERSITGRDAGPTGVVRISAAEWFCTRVLAPACAELSETHPGISIELIGEPRPANLSRREADIAFRFIRFEQGDIIQRRLGRVAFGLYAAPGYIERRGAPNFTTGLKGHSIITMRVEMASVADVIWLEEIAYSAAVALRADSREMQASAAVAGMGCACLPTFIGERTAGLVRLTTPAPVPDREIWMGIHADSHRTPRLRLAARLLALSIRRQSRLLDPEGS